MWRHALASCGQSGACSTGRNHANVPGRRRGAVFGARRALLAPPHPVAGHLTARGMPPGLSGPHIWRFFDFGGKLSSSLLHSSHFLWRRGGAGSGRQARSNGRRTRHEAPPSKAAARGRRAGCGAGAVQARQEFKLICAVAHSRRKARSAARRQLAKQRAAAVDAARITRVRSAVSLLLRCLRSAFRRDIAELGRAAQVLGWLRKALASDSSGSLLPHHSAQVASPV